jgi:hypothetical protein
LGKFYANYWGALGATLSPLLVSSAAPIAGGLMAMGAGMNAISDAYIDRNRNDTDALAQALAEGIVVQDEDGSLRSTDDSALAELGISTQQLKYFEM